MTMLPWFGAVLAAISVLVAYRIGFQSGFAAGKEAGFGDGKRAGKKEGAVRAYAVGFDRGKRSHESPASSGQTTSGEVSSWRFGLFVFALAFAAIATCFSRSPWQPFSKQSTQSQRDTRRDGSAAIGSDVDRVNPLPPTFSQSAATTSASPSP